MVLQMVIELARLLRMWDNMKISAMSPLLLCYCPHGINIVYLPCRTRTLNVIFRARSREFLQTVLCLTLRLLCEYRSSVPARRGLRRRQMVPW
jgi:hypothetical protein